MKKIKATILLLIIIPTIVNAAECDTSKVYIDSISIDGTTNVEELSPATANDKTINLNLAMNDVGDSINYKITIKNDSNEDYEIDNNSINVNSEYIDYSIESEDYSNVIKKKSSKTVNLNVQYKKTIPSNVFNNGVFNDSITMKVNLSTRDNNLLNPNTGIKYYLIIISILVISGLFYMFIKKYENTTIIFPVLIFLSIPIGVNAFCKCEISIKSNITIPESYSVKYVISKTIKNDEINNYTMFKYPDRPSCTAISDTAYSYCNIIAKQEKYIVGTKVDVLDNYDIAYIDNNENYYNQNIKIDGTIYRLWDFDNTSNTGGILIPKEKNMRFFWGYFKFPYFNNSLEQELIDFSGSSVVSQWNLPDDEGPLIYFATPTYFYMPKHDVIINQLIFIES